MPERRSEPEGFAPLDLVESVEIQIDSYEIGSRHRSRTA
jgi:hypothetical protein